MIGGNRLYKDEKLSMSEKEKDDFQWYKYKADLLDAKHMNLGKSYGGISEYRRMKVNYDLYNNVLNVADFEYVCKPFGSEVGELPARMMNRDITSPKIKAILGQEMKRPLSWNVIATNAEATTRKEQEEFGRIREYVVSEIVKPIREQIELQHAQEVNGKELTADQQEQIRQQIAEELQAQTPEEVKKYMMRQHQDPAEVMSQQLLNYLMQSQEMPKKFNKLFKHALLSSKGIMYVGVLNGEPQAWNVNSLRFNYDRSPDLDFVEDAEFASCEYRITPSEVIKLFGDQLTDDEIDKIYSSYSPMKLSYIREWLESEDDNYTYNLNEQAMYTTRVLHCVWKSLRKIGFLSYYDETGNVQETIVDETYTPNYEQGDISIQWEWIPEVYETWKINSDIYVNMRPIPGQFKDLDNLYKCKLPYYGAIYDNLNSVQTSLMDRLKIWQYYYNIVWYRLELLIASDKGKKVMMNINAIPSSAGIDMKKWQYFMESSPYMWIDTSEEGSAYSDVNTIAREIDLSLVSDIQKYVELLDYIRIQAGKSVGITDAVEGQIGANEAVSNTRQNLVQTSYILEPYFDLHNIVKKNILEALLDAAKVAYTNSPKRKISYIMDDMSQAVINLDIGLLNNSTIGLFVTNSIEADEIKQTIKMLAQAALQNQKAELSDVISIIRQNSIVESEETLRAAEQRRREYEMQLQREQQQAQAEQARLAREHEELVFEREKELIKLKESERRKTVVVQYGIQGASFNPNQDTDRDGVNDFLELAQHGLNTVVQEQKISLDRSKFEHQKKVDNEKLKNEKEKISIQKRKGNNSK